MEAKLKDLFDKAGMSFAFTTWGCGQEIIEKVMSRYRDQFIQLWHSELNRQTSERHRRFQARAYPGNARVKIRLLPTNFEARAALFLAAC